MQRCLELAARGAGKVAPNPMVGAVLLHKDEIIGEGWHQEYGQSHAEVNCIAAVKDEHKHLIESSTLYVSLEPCAHYGKTPPCADLIIRHKIPEVVVGCRDIFPAVDGRGIEKLASAGVKVVLGIMEQECIDLNRRFFTCHKEHRPYIILKWAQTTNGKISGGATDERLMISNSYSNQLVHRWRSEEAAVLVGTNTALYDNPQLTTRLWNGASPLRLIVDMHLRLPLDLNIFNNEAPTIIFNSIKHEAASTISYYQITSDVSLVHQILNALRELNIQSVMVEGGAQLLQSFIDEGIWDEARVIASSTVTASQGLDAPELKDASLESEQKLDTDLVRYYYHKTKGSNE